MKTKLIIRVEITHDTPKLKHQGLEVWCEGLRVGQRIHGRNGDGDSYELTVKSIKEINIK